MDESVAATVEVMQVDREAIISAANVLMVALLKMNRVLIPSLLKWRRQARVSWISAADDDIRNCGAKKSCMLSSPDLEDGGHPPHNEHEHRARVDRERFRRASAVNPLVYTSVFTVFFTIITVIVYSSIIIALVLSFYPLGPAQALIFSFSLVATATISEAETLLLQKKRPQSQPGSKKDISDVQLTAVVPRPSVSEVQAAGGKEEVPDEENGLLETSGSQRPYANGTMTFNMENVETDDFSDLE